MAPRNRKSGAINNNMYFFDQIQQIPASDPSCDLTEVCNEYIRDFNLPHASAPESSIQSSINAEEYQEEPPTKVMKSTSVCTLDVAPVQSTSGSGVSHPPLLDVEYCNRHCLTV